MSLKRILNISIENAQNGLVGLERYSQDIRKKCCHKYFHFILIDLQMPVMDGKEASKRIHQVFEKYKQKEEYSHIEEPKIFAVTAHIDSFYDKLARQTFILEVIHKPINMKKVLMYLKRHLGKKSLSKILF